MTEGQETKQKSPANLIRNRGLKMRAVYLMRLGGEFARRGSSDHGARGHFLDFYGGLLEDSGLGVKASGAGVRFLVLLLSQGLLLSPCFTLNPWSTE